MSKFRDCNHGQRVESAVYNEMWNLSCFPNEHKHKKGVSPPTEEEKEQSVVIGLRLCALPRNIGRISVRYRIRCIEFESASEPHVSWWSHSASFDYDNYYVKSPKHTIRSSVIEKYDALTFVTQIDVLEMFDLDGHTMGNSTGNSMGQSTGQTMQSNT